MPRSPFDFRYVILGRLAGFQGFGARFFGSIDSVPRTGNTDFRPACKRAPTVGYFGFLDASSRILFSRSS
jgi:hypothetical protein